MKKNIHIRTLSDISEISSQKEEIRDVINCIALDKTNIQSYFSEPVFIKASIAILVLSGTSHLSINYKTYTVDCDTLILLSASHLFCFDNCSPDFHCYCLLSSRDFSDAMDTTEMVYKRMKYEVKIFRTPTIRLGQKNILHLYHRLKEINLSIENTTHRFYKEVILNRLFAFYLDVSHCIDSLDEFYEEVNITRQESYIKEFIELLVDHYRKEHNIEFYASRLNISTHYLTVMVKHFTGQSVSAFIFEMLYSESRNLLKHSKLSIQEIAMTLNFSDQSSFGKFFKRKSGISPLGYRKI